MPAENERKKEKHSFLVLLSVKIPNIDIRNRTYGLFRFSWAVLALFLSKGGPCLFCSFGDSLVVPSLCQSQYTAWRFLYFLDWVWPKQDFSVVNRAKGKYCDGRLPRKHSVSIKFQYELQC